MGISNAICRNFEYKDLDSIHLNCDKCKFNGNCDIQTAYYKPKSIDENITKGFEEFTKMMFRQGQAEREG